MERKEYRNVTEGGRDERVEKHTATGDRGDEVCSHSV